MIPQKLFCLVACRNRTCQAEQTKTHYIPPRPSALFHDGDMNTKEPPNSATAAATNGHAVGELLHRMARAATNQAPAAAPAPPADNTSGTVQFSCRLSAKNHQRLQALADAAGVTRTAALNATLSAALTNTSGDNQ